MQPTPQQPDEPGQNRTAPPASLARRRAGVVVGTLLLALLLANVPFLYGYAVRPPGTRFLAIPPVNYGDANQYLAFTHIASEGALLIGDPFTTEPHEPRLLMPVAQFEGLLCRLFGWSPVEANQASRVLFGALLLGVGWWFGTLFLRRWPARRLYLALLCFSAGAGWIVERLGWRIPNGDVLQPEANTFFTVGNLAHLGLSNALLTLLFGTLVMLERDRGRPAARRWVLLTFFCAALLSWVHPFDFLALGLGIGSYGLLRWVGDRRFPVVSALHAAAIFLGALPAAAYLFWLTRTDPLYHALANDVLRVQPFAYYAIAHGWFVLAALPVLLRAETRRRYLLPLCWVAGVFLFLMTPLRLGGKQPRTPGGIHVPLAVLAVAGIEAAAREAARRSGRGTGARRAQLFTAVGGTFFLVSATGVAGIVQRHLEPYARRLPDHYLSPGIQRAFRYLHQQTDWSGAAVAGTYTGNWAPTWADTRVFHGHWHMTLQAPQKERERDWFFTAPQVPPSMRAWWLQARGIDWVIWYPWEWRGYAVPLDGVPGLERVLTEPDVVLYRVRKEGPGAPQPDAR